MPGLDRRIIVRRTVTTRNQFGESVEDVTDFPMWATREDSSAKLDKEMAGGVLTLAARAYLIRYSSELADAITSELIRDRRHRSRSMRPTSSRRRVLRRAAQISDGLKLHRRGYLNAWPCSNSSESSGTRPTPIRSSP